MLERCGWSLRRKEIQLREDLNGKGQEKKMSGRESEEVLVRKMVKKNFRRRASEVRGAGRGRKGKRKVSGGSGGWWSGVGSAKRRSMETYAWWILRSLWRGIIICDIYINWRTRVVASSVALPMDANGFLLSSEMFLIIKKILNPLILVWGSV